MEKNILYKLLKEEAYPEYMIEGTVAKLEKLQPEIDSAFSAWVLDSTKPDIIVEGYTFDSLVRDFGMKPVGAFLTLDWLVREPKSATAALKRGIR